MRPRFKFRKSVIAVIPAVNAKKLNVSATPVNATTAVVAVAESLIVKLSVAAKVSAPRNSSAQT